MSHSLLDYSLSSLLLFLLITPHITLIFHRYYDQLNALEVKIPIHEFQVPFKYKDAFDKGSIFGGKASLSKYAAYQLSQYILIY